jgi:hypothetical protein
MKSTILLAALMVSAPALTIDQRVTDLERRVTALENAQSSVTQKSSATTQTVVAHDSSPLELDSWSYRVVNTDISKDYEITLNLKNTGTKDIKLIDGSVIFKDLLGERIYGITVSPDQIIEAGKIQTDTGDYEINEFISDQTRMMKMKKEDIQATLIVHKIVFSDNSIGEYSQ